MPRGEVQDLTNVQGDARVVPDDDCCVALLPYLTAGPVITTNYDRVLERAFDLANRPFTRSIVGARRMLDVLGVSAASVLFKTMETARHDEA
jgi:hypothetical protein